LPGLLVTLALLSLGAPICYNVLKSVASLRPPAMTTTSFYPDRRIRREDRRQPQVRELVRSQSKGQVKVPEKPQEKIPEKSPEKLEEDRKPVTAGHIDKLL